MISRYTSINTAKMEFWSVLLLSIVGDTLVGESLSYELNVKYLNPHEATVGSLCKSFIMAHTNDHMQTNNLNILYTCMYNK